MPIFEFECVACGKKKSPLMASYERSQTDPPTCECGAPMLKQVSAPAFTVQGFNAKNGYGVKA